ncbi:hypothetical protein H648_39484gpHYPp6 [Human mastadenovirus D]|uniref:Uncharacterized protein n=1 Tax=Human mastadenovirus D TaxID=130310 RepID=T1UEV0_9ADEN|nr:hypothetical protein H648_37081gpHYPp6 [Human mastadenovirus D]AGT76357.1 hypothetical protein H648_37082gpHYPp6 [Human mastadenovirus D]AGT77465.1 hypothetical protein H648_39484gpHYPp6 [Human mastadenovirus D]AGT78034.1 hypothetical protein H648_42832gpHYPp6 [Human mastadenovirus D]
MHEPLNVIICGGGGVFHAGDPDAPKRLHERQVGDDTLGEDGLLHAGEGVLEVVHVNKAVVGPGVNGVGAVGHKRPVNGLQTGLHDLGVPKPREGARVKDVVVAGAHKVLISD